MISATSATAAAAAASAATPAGSVAGGLSAAWSGRRRPQLPGGPAAHPHHPSRFAPTPSTPLGLHARRVRHARYLTTPRPARPCTYSCVSGRPHPSRQPRRSAAPPLILPVCSPGSHPFLLPRCFPAPAGSFPRTPFPLCYLSRLSPCPPPPHHGSSVCATPIVPVARVCCHPPASTWRAGLCRPPGLPRRPPSRGHRCRNRHAPVGTGGSVGGRDGHRRCCRGGAARGGHGRPRDGRRRGAGRAAGAGPPRTVCRVSSAPRYGQQTVAVGGWGTGMGAGRSLLWFGGRGCAPPLGFACIFVGDLRVLRLAAGSRLAVVWRAGGCESP